MRSSHYVPPAVPLVLLQCTAPKAYSLASFVSDNTALKLNSPSRGNEVRVEVCMYASRDNTQEEYVVIVADMKPPFPGNNASVISFSHHNPGTC